MNYFLLGKGKVGSAVAGHFKKNNIPLHTFDQNKFEKDSSGILFLAVPDDAVANLYAEISDKFQNLKVIHFSAASDTEDMHLLHPYCSIGKDTDLSDVVFTLWSKDREDLEKILHSIRIDFIYAGVVPSALYHTSAVLSGNFAQFFSIAALELLKKEGFTEKNALRILNQLMLSSLSNISLGTKGISGPASRGDISTIKNETRELRKINKDLSEVFEKINKMIGNTLRNGTILTR